MEIEFKKLKIKCRAIKTPPELHLGALLLILLEQPLSLSLGTFICISAPPSTPLPLPPLSPPPLEPPLSRVSRSWIPFSLLCPSPYAALLRASSINRQPLPQTCKSISFYFSFLFHSALELKEI